MSTESRSMMPVEKLPRSERRELGHGADGLLHTITSATVQLNHALENSIPDLDTSANAFVPSQATALDIVAQGVANTYQPVQPSNPAMSEVVPEFAEDFSPDKLWDGSLAADNDEPRYRPVAAADVSENYQSAVSPYVEVTSAPDASMAGMPVDQHLRYVEAVQAGGVYDQLDMAEVARRQIDDAHAQGEQR